MSTDAETVRVARIGRAHGLRGEVTLELRTDDPQARLGVGQVLETEPSQAGPLTVVGARPHGPAWLVQFAEVSDRTAAEALRGVSLLAPADDRREADAWYPHQLAGLRAELGTGEVVGEVVGVQHGSAQDALVIRELGGETSLVPLVSQIVPVVDLAGGKVVLDPPAGLLASDAENVIVVDPPAAD